jgi:choloylglycine hydrolase
MNKILTGICAAAMLLAFVLCANACTSIRIKTTDGYVFYARTMEGEVDFKSNVAIIPKGIEYIGTLPDNTQKGLKWSTRYGAVGMNTYGLPFLSDGMNEKGLAAGNLLFPGFAEYQPYNAAQASKTIAQWEVVTWILTNFSTVDEVKEAIKTIRVSKGPEDTVGFLQLHFVVHDANGGCIVIEHVNGEMKIYDNPLGVMTNSPPFDWHMINLRNHINISATNVKPIDIDGLKETGLGQGTGMLGLPGDYTPPSRFVRMVALTSSAIPVTGPDEGLNLAMTIIDNADIARGVIRSSSGKETLYDITNWTVISDLGRKKFYFRTYANKDWRCVDVTKALSNAKGITLIKADTPPDYRDITATAGNYTLPPDLFPSGKP